MKKIYHYLLAIIFLMTSTVALSQQKKNVNNGQVKSTQPKLVVGLVIDQMRWDYLYKYKDLYGKDGFNRLMNEGFNCENTLITHLPTYTAVGHAGIYTGSFPAIHGIVGNNWSDRITGKSVYCTDDDSVIGVGSNGKEGKMSPKNMLANSIADELRLSNNFKSKVIGISLKDRGAILPAGHAANAAYWFEDSEGKWITSSYYMKELPQWVTKFNDTKQPDSFMKNDWKLLMPSSSYSMSTPDEMSYEEKIPGDTADGFPHMLSSVKSKKYNAFRYTPFGNTFTLNFAKQAIANERLGKNGVTDFLAVSLSSTDYIGHAFGPNSVEIEDTYIRLDKDIATFLQYLDQQIGKGNYLLFLSADHGVSNNTAFLNEHHLPGGNFSKKELIKEINDSIRIKTQSNFDAILKIENAQVYLNQNIDELGAFNLLPVKQLVVSLLLKKNFITNVFDYTNPSISIVPTSIKSKLENSYFPSRSGDLQIIYAPNFFDGGKTGTTHGSWNPYDANIPLMFYGWGISKGNSHREIHMADIAPTLAALLNIQMPNGCVGQVIQEVIK